MLTDNIELNIAPSTGYTKRKMSTPSLRLNIISMYAGTLIEQTKGQVIFCRQLAHHVIGITIIEINHRHTIVT